MPSTSNTDPIQKLTVDQLKTLLRQRGLPVSGRKDELIQRLNGSHPTPTPTTKAPHPMPLEQMKVRELRSLLKQRGLPVSGKKAELIKRLKNGSSGGPKPKPWQHSSAKKDLKRALLDPTSPIHNMSVEDIRNSDER